MSSVRLWLYHCLTCALPESRAYAWKRALLRWAGADVGENVRIYSSARFLGTGRLKIGDDVHVGPGVFISTAAPAAVTIGSHVDVGPGVMIVNGSHEVDFDGPHVAGRGIARDVTVGDGCWLGARSVLLAGVELPEKTLVAAGAVVIGPVEGPRHLVGGVPARILR